MRPAARPMFGDVPLSVPLLETDVLILGRWLLERMNIPVRCRPFAVGLFGMPRDLSPDPLSGRQAFTAGGGAGGRGCSIPAPSASTAFRSTTIPGGC